MTKSRATFLRGLTVQLLAVTVLPLTVLLLLIAFGSVSLHQQDMRALVGERDERAVQVVPHLPVLGNDSSTILRIRAPAPSSRPA